jgi:hypothetical protein
MVASATGVGELRHQLTMGQKRYQPLLWAHAPYFFAETAASGVGQSRFHGVM